MRLIADKKDSNTTKAVEILSHLLITANPDISLFNAVKIMEKKIRRLSLAKDNSLLGFLTITDIIKPFHSLHKDEQYLLKFILRYKSISRNNR